MVVAQGDVLLTIAIPTYNRKKLLKRALDTIMPQLNPKIEVLVSDNASDDGTDKMMTEFYPTVRYIKNNTNIGADGNFLQCYREANGKYVILFGSDDKFIEGSLDYLTDFLEKNNCDLVFLNYRRFDTNSGTEYIKDSEKIKNYKEKQDIVTSNRSVYMKYANYNITFMSASIIKKSLVMDIKNPQQFIGSYFLHTNIMLSSVKAPNSIFGVIMQPLVEGNATSGDSEMSKMPEKTFRVFGKCMYSVLCDHAVKCGFSERQMKKVYQQYLHDYPFWKLLLSYKRQGNAKALEIFSQDGYPVVKHFPGEWIKVILVKITPHYIINIIYKIYKSLKKGK